MQRFIWARLSVMMFMQFFIWGTWAITVGNFMRVEGMAELIYWPYAANSIGAVVSPFLLGMVADRFFPTEKVLGVTHLLGALTMLAIPSQVESPFMFCALLLVFNLCFMATVGLANTLTFHNISRQEKQFPLIRVFGTFGWIAGGLVVGHVLGQYTTMEPDETALPLYMAGFVNLALALYSFTLPHTPPPALGQKVSMRTIAGIDALKHLGSRSFYVFVVCITLLYIPMTWYTGYAPVYVDAVVYEVGTSGFMTTIFPNPSSLMSMGQMSEIFFMLMIPLVFARLGVKWMFAAGMAGWALRYSLFALGAPETVFWMIAGGIILHGICYDFIFVTGQIYLDKKATKEIRGQAQGFMVLITYGIGHLIGSGWSGASFNSFLEEGQTTLSLADWQSFWWVPVFMAAGLLILFVLLFNERIGKDTPSKSGASAEPAARTAEARV